MKHIRQWCENSIKSIRMPGTIDGDIGNLAQREWVKGYMSGLGDIAKVIKEAEAREAEKVPAVLISTVLVLDPVTGGEFEVELWKDPVANAIFGIDSTYLDQAAPGEEEAEIQSPFNPEITLLLPADAIEKAPPPDDG